MKKNFHWSAGASINAFIIGVILLWSFGKNWLKIESPLVFLAGLIGVAIAVLFISAWKIRNRSDKNDK